MTPHAVLAQLAGRSYLGPWSGCAAADCQYDLLPRDDELIVVMPGTDPADALDWLRDLSFAPCWVAGVGPAHSGFAEGGEALFARVGRVTAGDIRPLTFCGHSLGGALALMLAALFAARRPAIRFRVVTFGAPRLGFLNPWLPLLVGRGSEAVEYRRAGDIVPDAPTWPFHHAARGRRIGRTVLLGDPEAAIVANHAIDRYAADLAALTL